ncbi:MAG TPA: hypothetical protein VJU34_01505, partial [Phenylobacterium sp.]|nr:hypothetical protein [Phenylobacterium sp.]
DGRRRTHAAEDAEHKLFVGVHPSSPSNAPAPGRARRPVNPGKGSGGMGRCATRTGRKRARCMLAC